MYLQVVLKEWSKFCLQFQESVALICPLRRMGQGSPGEPEFRLHTALKQHQCRLWLLASHPLFSLCCVRVVA